MEIAVKDPPRNAMNVMHFTKRIVSSAHSTVMCIISSQLTQSAFDPLISPVAAHPTDYTC